MKGRDVILGLLLQKPMSGYDIKQRFETIFAHFFDASYGTIYPTLAKMEKDGYIVKETVIQEGKPNKNIYSITEKGKELFYHYLQSPVESEVIRSDFLMRMYFGHHVGTEQSIAWLKDEISKTKEILVRLQEDYRAWKDKMSPTQVICIEMGISYNEAKLKTYEKGLKSLLERGAE